MYFSQGVVQEVGEELSGFLGFHKVQDLGTYLGTLLFHKRSTITSLRFIVEKVRAKLCNWDASKLSIAGRFTLAQSILLTIPNYFMQTMRLYQGFVRRLSVLPNNSYGALAQGNESQLWLTGILCVNHVPIEAWDLDDLRIKIPPFC